MSFPTVTSKDNPLVRTIRQVAQQAGAHPPDLVVAEGLRLLEEATTSNCALEAVLLAESFGNTKREAALMDAWEHKKVPIRRASSSILKWLSDVVTPQGALALVRIPALALADVAPALDPLILCLCSIQDPGNFGTLLRTGRAAGVSLVCATAGTVSARNPKTIRASAGASFHIPVVEGLTPAEFTTYCRTHKVSMFQARGRADRSCWSMDLSGPTAILLGNEAHGLPDAGWEGVSSIRVPMSSGVESLNVAIAGAVLLFEAFRQRSLGAAAKGMGT